MVSFKLVRGFAVCALLAAAAAQNVADQSQSSSGVLAGAPSQAVSGQQGAFAGAPSQGISGQQQGAFAGAPSQAMAGQQGMVSGAASSQSDIDALNYALQISYLEAAFYNQAAFGRAVRAIAVSARIAARAIVANSC